MKKGFTLIELLIVVAIIAILAAIAVPNFLEAQTRAKVSRVKNDQRSLATGLEAYYVDNNSYPCAGSDATGDFGVAPGVGEKKVLKNPTGAGNQNKYLPNKGTAIPSIYSFSARGTTLTAGVTTPISYITSVFPDPFMDTKGATFCYLADTNGWILWSPGPDTDEAQYTDLQGPTGSAATVETAYSSNVAQPSVFLLTGGTAGGESFTYDPTNGTTSPGDIYRPKQ